MLVTLPGLRIKRINCGQNVFMCACFCVFLVFFVRNSNTSSLPFSRTGFSYIKTF